MSSYVPSAKVQAANNIPHLNSRLQSEDVAFSLSLAYAEDILYFPLVLVGVSIVLCVGFLVLLCCAGCYRRCCRSAERYRLDPFRLSFSQKVTKRLSHHEYVVRLFFAALCGLLVASGFMWFGTSEATAAFTQLLSGANTVDDTFNDVTASSDAILAYSNNITQIANSSTICPVLNPTTGQPTGVTYYHLIQSDLSTVNADSNSIIDNANPLVNQVENFINAISSVDFSRVYAVVGAFFTVIVLDIACFCSAWYYKNKLLFRLTIAFTWLVTFSLLIVSSVETLLVMFLGDFCENPSSNLLNAVPSSIYSVVEFYLTCTGSNPFDTYITQANQTVVSLDNSVQSSYSAYIISANCAKLIDINLNQISVQLTNINSDVNECASLNSAYSQFVEQAVCSKGFDSVFDTWIVQFVVSMCLYAVMCLANATYQSYVFVPNLDVPINRSLLANIAVQTTAEVQTGHNNNTILNGYNTNGNGLSMEPVMVAVSPMFHEDGTINLLPDHRDSASLSNSPSSRSSRASAASLNVAAPQATAVNGQSGFVTLAGMSAKQQAAYLLPSGTAAAGVSAPIPLHMQGSVPMAQAVVLTVSPMYTEQPPQPIQTQPQTQVAPNSMQRVVPISDEAATDNLSYSSFRELNQRGTDDNSNDAPQSL